MNLGLSASISFLIFLPMARLNKSACPSVSRPLVLTDTVVPIRAVSNSRDKLTHLHSHRSSPLRRRRRRRARPQPVRRPLIRVATGTKLAYSRYTRPTASHRTHTGRKLNSARPTSPRGRRPGSRRTISDRRPRPAPFESSSRRCASWRRSRPSP